MDEETTGESPQLEHQQPQQQTELEPQLEPLQQSEQQPHEQQQPQHPPQQLQVQPILRKKPPGGHSETGAPVNHVRIAPAPTSCDTTDDDDDATTGSAEPWPDRENPFRPGSDLDREADSLLRNSRISRNSVHLPGANGGTTAAAEAAEPPQEEPSVREDTVGLLMPSTAVTAVIPDDATDSGPDDGGEFDQEDVDAVDEPVQPRQQLQQQHQRPPDSNGSTVPSSDSAKVKEEAVAVASRVATAHSSSACPVPSKAEAVQMKSGGRACCDLM